jgi:hypothetical protein
MLAHDTQWRAEGDLRVFAEWHAALGTDPEVALWEMREKGEASRWVIRGADPRSVCKAREARTKAPLGRQLSSG